MYSRPLEITERRYLLGLFLNGLKEEVTMELKLQSFDSLDELMDLAEKAESGNIMLHKGASKNFGRFVNYTGSSRPGLGSDAGRTSSMGVAWVVLGAAVRMGGFLAIMAPRAEALDNCRVRSIVRNS